MAPKKRGRPANKPAAIVLSDEEIDLPAPKKAKTVDDLFDQSPVKQQKKDAQIAHTKGLAVPVDDHCPLDGTHRVHIDDDGTIYDVSLNQTNIGDNNNKFYRIQILQDKSDGDFVTWTRWGRVGDRGQSKLLNRGDFYKAFADFNKKFKEKTKLNWDQRHDPPKPKSYTFVERSYEPDSSSDDEQVPADDSRRGSKHSILSTGSTGSKLPLPVQQMMELIFNAEYFKEVMAEMNYDNEKLPLGKLSRRAIERGYEQLKALAAVILDTTADPTLIASRNEQILSLSSSYFSQIPHNFGRNRPPPIAGESQLRREIDLLDSLSDMKIAEDIIKDAKSKSGPEDMHPVDRQYAGLGMSEMTPLEPKSTEFLELEAYLQGTRGGTHDIKYEVEDIFRIERSGEFDRFDESKYGAMNADRRLLWWHGSRATNFGGILSQGLRIAPPEAPVSGYMFGKGVYLADMSSKSANYCYHGQSGNVGLLLLCEAELGKPLLELTQADYEAGERAARQGSYTTWGKGSTAPLKWKDAGVVNEHLAGVTMPDVSVKPGDTNVPGAWLQYNEYIAYDVAQIRMRYLFRVKMSHGRGW